MFSWLRPCRANQTTELCIMVQQTYCHLSSLRLFSWPCWYQKWLRGQDPKISPLPGKSKSKEKLTRMERWELTVSIPESDRGQEVPWWHIFWTMVSLAAEMKSRPLRTKENNANNFHIAAEWCRACIYKTWTANDSQSDYRLHDDVSFCLCSSVAAKTSSFCHYLSIKNRKFRW